MWCHHLCPEKKGSQGWAISLPCVHSNETWRRLHEIYTYLTVTVYWASCFVQHCQFANRLRDSELKISFEDSHHPDRPLSAWTSKVSFLRGTISKEDTHITIGEAWERCDVSVSDVMFQLAKLKEQCPMIWTWRKQLRQTDRQTNSGMFEPDERPCDVVTGEET